MKAPFQNTAALRHYRNAKLYRSLTRTLKVYNRRLVQGLHARGFEDFSPAFPTLLSNLDIGGTQINVLAARAGVSRQAAGQLRRAIERCGYVSCDASPDDARAKIVRFTARGKRLLAAVLDLVEQIEGEFEGMLSTAAFEQVRQGLHQVADRIDPGGALGAGDTVPDGSRKRRAVRTP